MVKTVENTSEYWKVEYEKQVAENTVLKEQILYLTHKLFGKKSEKRPEIEGQQCLYEEDDVPVAVSDMPDEIEHIEYKRVKQKGKRKEDLSGLPVEQIIYDLDEDDKSCPKCGEDLIPIGREVRREVKVTPPQFSVIEHISIVYGCRPCELNSEEPMPVVKAPIPEPVIKNSFASPSAVAHVMTQKFVNAMPLYRQEQDYHRNGFSLSRQTMSNWMIKGAFDWLLPLYLMLKTLLLERDIGHADETIMQVLHEPGKKAETKSYMWMYRTCGDTDKHIVVFEYQPDRRHARPKDFLKGFKGYLHTDGYEAYHNLPNYIIVVGCFAHCRRKWEDALKVTPKELRESSFAYKGLAFCQTLFMMERKFKDMSPDERYEARLEQSLPIAKQFFSWIKTVNALPKSALGKAVTYTMNQQQYLMNIYLDGRLEFSNNRAENSMRPLTVGRKNWLFSNTVDGAKSSAIIYSIVQTAMDNGLNPFKYLEYLFEQLPNSNESIKEFLPWNKKVFDICRMPESGKESNNVKKEYKLYDEICKIVS